MISEFVDCFMGKKAEIEAVFKEKHPDEYEDIVKVVIGALADVFEYGSPDPSRIHEINDGDYQGTLVYIIGAKGYQPDKYWYVKVGYGSCSGCDTLEGIKNYSHDTPTEEQVKDYMTLALHIVQDIKLMGEADE